jgi:hypothetical protein
MSSFYVFDATRNFYENGKGDQVSLLSYIDCLQKGCNNNVDITDLADNKDDLKVLLERLDFPVFVFDSNFDFVGSFNEPDCLPSSINRDFEVDGEVSKQIDFFVRCVDGFKVFKGVVHFSDDVTTCGTTYAIKLELFDFDCELSFDMDIAEEAVLLSINEGQESCCFFDEFSYKLYDINY